MASGSTPRRQPVGEVLMDFADGGSYNQARLGEVTLEVEKTRQAFEKELQARRTKKEKAESSLKDSDVQDMVDSFSLTQDQAKTLLVAAGGDLAKCRRSYIQN